MKTINDQILNMKQVGFLTFLSFFGLQKPYYLQFPKKVGDYVFVRQILKRQDRPFSFAIYRNGKGQEAIAKMWTGTKKDFSFFSLENEKLILNKITNLYKSRGQLSGYKTIAVPKILAFVKHKQYLILLSEKVNGRTLDHIPLTKRIEIYEDVVSYIRELGLHIDKRGITVRTNLSLLAAFFLLFIKSLFTHPKILPFACRGAALFIKGIPRLITDNRLSLVHKSIESHNIFFNGNKISIIDFELSCFAHPLTEIAQLLVFSFDDNTFIHAFSRTKTMNAIYKSKSETLLLQTICLYEVFVQLALGNKKDFVRNSAFLKYLTQRHYDK